MALPEEKYTGDDYLLRNPSWDMEDSPWKAAVVSEFLKAAGLNPGSVCEIGYGAAFHTPQSTWKTKLISIPRAIARFLDKDWGVRIMGGETLLVLARAPGGVSEK
ncbi:MAG: hypothetical protein A2X28_01890 [Elusimicrobia bacterium GWA2_56_46]|nr:MAG: hypothetical protein A2X28_01890 [Elusimicrobia bacterium GWA2_56_46]OGR55478.1 MAG: hypothetical protein A2X39_01075 [Elusimicrobia bacterium GWC2_56_31]HBW21946.1 hypothetical protein [Elusimicrobiota bacterium]